jgi:hypothetical protein
MGYMHCLNCKKLTLTNNLYCIAQAEKYGDCYYLKGSCNVCGRNKSKKLGKVLSNGYTINSPHEELLKLLPSEEPKKTVDKVDEVMKVDKVDKMITGGSMAPETMATAMTAEDIDGEGLWDSIKNFGRKPQSFTDKLGDTAAKATKSLIRGIPIVGDLLVDSGVVDTGIDLFSEYVWQPIKKFFGGNIDEKILESLKDDNRWLTQMSHKVMNHRIKTGDGIIPKYLGELKNGTEEENALAHVLFKTVCSPKFYKFLKDDKIPSTMSILEAMNKYQSRPKLYKNAEEKSLEILKELGYNCV